MGLYKDMEASGSARDRDGAASDPPDEAQQAAQQAADQPVDLTDPIWAPVEGITLDKYAQLTAAMARQEHGSSDRLEAWLEDHGVAPGTWPEVQAGWVDRMATHEAVRTRYGILYSRT